MSSHLVGPGGLRVEAVRLDGPHLLLARLVDATAQPGEVWYRITRRGVAVGGGYFRDIEAVAEIVDLADLRGPKQVDEETA